MSIRIQELFQLARKVETRIAALYEDLSAQLQAGSDEARFFAKMAAQEHMHAAWVDEMAAGIVEDVTIESLNRSDFETILSTIEDVHDEVVTETVDLCGGLEIILHLEESAAEEFYRHFPKNIPGLPDSMVDKMIRSCTDHAEAVQAFQKCYTCHLQQSPLPDEDTNHSAS